MYRPPPTWCAMFLPIRPVLRITDPPRLCPTCDVIIFFNCVKRPPKRLAFMDAKTSNKVRIVWISRRRIFKIWKVKGFLDTEKLNLIFIYISFYGYLGIIAAKFYGRCKFNDWKNLFAKKCDFLSFSNQFSVITCKNALFCFLQGIVFSLEMKMWTTVDSRSNILRWDRLSHILLWVLCYFDSEFWDFCYSSEQKYFLVYWVVCCFGSLLLWESTVII
jgi:hypothetical protein